MKTKYAFLNIKLQWLDKFALINYARSQGENISVVVRKLIKDEMIRKGYLHPNRNLEKRENPSRFSNNLINTEKENNNE